METSPRQFVRERLDRYHTVGLRLLALIEALGLGAVAQREVGRFDKGPGEILVAVLAVAFALLLAVAGVHTVNTARVGGEVAGGSGNGVQNASFSFDALGNLLSRSDAVNGQAAQSYGYDLLNRLITQNGSGIASYDAAGNLRSKSGVSSAYVYLAGTHKVQSAGGYSLEYDANGNVTRITGNGASKTLNYRQLNLPESIVAEGNTLSYLYDGAHARIKETVSTNQGSSSTYYLGGFELHTRSDGVVEERHYLSTPEGAVGIHTRRSSGVHDTRYWFKDHLGSIVAITDAAGSVKARYAYDAWGKRSTTFGGEGEERGFTGHEHLIEAGLIHMNGRLYFEPLGRMLQADPIIQEPLDGQNYNRYSYVLNNPLAFTDPTGFSWWTKWRRSVAAIVASVFMQFYLMPMLLEGVAISAEVANFVTAVASGFAAGGIQGGNIESALTGAMFAGAFYGVGELTGAHASAAKPEFFLSAEHVRQVAGHAVLGCTQAVMAGGNCRSGALSAAIPAAAGPKLPGEVGTLTNMLGRAVVGAIASRLGGGRAELGAFQAVFAYLTNDMATEMSVDGSTITVEVGNYPQSANEWFVGFAKFSDPIFGVSSIAVCAAEGCSAGGWTLALAAVTPVGRAAKGATPLLQAPRQIEAAWGASTYRHGGLMTGIEHVMYRHGPNSGFSNVSRFAEGTRMGDISRYVDSAFRSGTVTGTGRGAYTVEYNLGRTIGTDVAGNAASSIRVHVRDGVIQTAFPF